MKGRQVQCLCLKSCCDVAMLLSFSVFVLNTYIRQGLNGVIRQERTRMSHLWLTPLSLPECLDSKPANQGHQATKAGSQEAGNNMNRALLFIFLLILLHSARIDMMLLMSFNADIE